MDKKGLIGKFAICNSVPTLRPPISLTLSGTRPAVEVASTSGLDGNGDCFQLQPMQYLSFFKSNVEEAHKDTKGHFDIWSCDSHSAQCHQILQLLKGIVHNFVVYRSNLIFWIVMGCGIADFGRRGL